MFGYSLDFVKSWGWSVLLYVIKQLGYLSGIATTVAVALTLYLTKGLDLLLDYFFEELLPKVSTYDWSQVRFYLECANWFLPIKEAIIAVAAMWAGKAAFIGIKLFVKIFLPGLG